MNSNKKILSVLLFVSLLIISSCSKNEIESYQIQKGKFVQTITETGELAAINVKAFVMPRFGQYWYQMKIIGLLDHGDIVQPGDSVIQFDPTKIKKFIIEKENELETQKANLEKILVQIENRKSELRSSLRSEQASFDLKKLEMEQFRFESDKIKSLKELEFKQAELRLNKVKRSIELYETISQNQLKIQQINVKRRSEEIKNAYDVLPQLTVRTPIPGIFQIARKRRSHELLKIGDEVYVGNRLGNVPDLTWMKVNTIVNEADFLKIKEGQKVNVRLDALPNVVFNGEVSTISKLCRPIERDSRQKIFDIEVKIKVSDERLKPGMTVSCEFICAELEDAFYAPVQCVESIEGVHYVTLKKGMEKMAVNIGPSNNSHVVLKGNFKSGTQLVPVSSKFETTNN